MRRHLNRPEAVGRALRRLERYSTLPPFCRLFYRYLNDLLMQDGMEEPRLEQAFLLFLRCETRRHQGAARVVSHGKLNVDELLRVARSAHEMTERLQRAVERIEVAGAQDALFKDLLLAECNYHLGRTEDVVARLTDALGRGCRHPLVHFAVGYNSYVLAVQRFTDPGRRRGELRVREPEALRAACLESIEMFERGLGDPSYDAQIHWWVGLIFEMVGDRDSACGAYQRAMDVDPEHFTTMCVDKIQKLEAPVRVERSPGEARRLDRLGPITPEEIAQAREFLAKMRGFPE